MFLLVSKINNPHLERGDIHEARNDGSALGGLEGASYCGIEVTGQSVPSIYANKKWKTSVQWSIITPDLANDAFRIELTSSLANGLLGKITLSDVADIITEWGGTAISSGDNSVQFDITIFDAIKSPGFWRADQATLSGFVFNDVYTQAGGIHRISCDYSATSIPFEYILSRIVDKGGTDIVNQGNVVDFTITRNVVRDAFIAKLQTFGARDVAVNRYKVSEILVSQAEASPGQVLYTDLATLQAGIVDKVA